MKKLIGLVMLVAGCLAFVPGCAVEGGEEESEAADGSEDGEDENVASSSDALGGHPYRKCTAVCSGGKWERCAMTVSNRCTSGRGGWANFNGPGENGSSFWLDGGKTRTFYHTSRTDIRYGAVSTNGAECLTVSATSTCVTAR